MQGSATASASNSPWRLPAAFFALLFFLGSADKVFATRLFGMNFRWAQLLMMAGVVFLAFSGHLTAALRDLRAANRSVKLTVLAWSTFFVIYAIAGLRSEAPRLSLIKLSWGLFNIGGAALICLGSRSRHKDLLQGLVVGFLLVCLVVWIDAAAILLGHLPGPVVGLSQESLIFEGIRQMRPHAFYYEPSYAGATLAILTPLFFVATAGLPTWLRWAAPAITLATVVMTSARTGILGVSLALGLTFLASWWLKAPELRRRIVATAGVAALILTAFFLTTDRASNYGRFIFGPLGPQGIYSRLSAAKPTQFDKAVGFGDKAAPVARESSEVDRLGSLKKSIRHWREHFWLGWGVEEAPAGDPAAVGRVIRPQVINTWLEVANESGILGLLSFFSSIALTLWVAFRRASSPQVKAVLLASWAVHLGCNLNFTQTFPRLDYWLVFFTAIRLATMESEPAAVTASYLQPTTEPQVPRQAAASAALANQPAHASR